MKRQLNAWLEIEKKICSPESTKSAGDGNVTEPVYKKQKTSATSSTNLNLNGKAELGVSFTHTIEDNTIISSFRRSFLMMII